MPDSAKTGKDVIGFFYSFDRWQMFPLHAFCSGCRISGNMININYLEFNSFLQMRSFFLLLISALTICKINAQNVDSLFQGVPVVPFISHDGDLNINNLRKNTYDQIGKTLSVRERNLDFYHVLLNISEPSTVSGIGTDYTFEEYKANQKKPFLFDIDIKAPVALGGKTWNLFTIHLIPEFMVRVFQDDPRFNDRSHPVRTPGYLPAGIVYFAPGPNWWIRDKSGLNGKYIGVKFFHSSNGQDGSEFGGPYAANPGQINLYNGNFEEFGVFELSYGHIHEYISNYMPNRQATVKHKLKVAEQRVQPDISNRLLYWHIGYEYHPDFFTDPEFLKYHLYGRNRINFQAGYSIMPSYRDIILNADANKYYAVTPNQAKESWRFVVNISYIADIQYNEGDMTRQNAVSFFNISKRMNLNITAYRRIPGTQNAGIFLQTGYYGSDIYNIYFEQSLWQVRAGIALAFFRFPDTNDFSHNLFQ